MPLPGFDLLTKAARLLIGRRYTSTDLSDSQESFTSTIQMGSNEIWSQTKLIPTSSLPFYTLPSAKTTSSLGVVKYWYKWPLTVANNTTLTASSVWFFLNPSGSNSGVGSQLIQAGQQANFINPKYSEVALTNYYADGDYNPESAGYNIALFSSANGSTFTQLSPSATYQFDYKTGVLEFTSTTIPADRVYATAYQYIGKTLSDVNDVEFNSITASVISSSVIIGGQITGSSLSVSQMVGSIGDFDQLTASNALIKNNLWVNGNLYASTISSSIVYITSSHFIVTDNIITVNALSPYVRYAGIEMYDSGSGTLSSLLWDSQNNYFFVSSSDAGYARQVILGPDLQNSLTPGYLPLIHSSNSITSSIIQQNENLITVAGRVSASSFTGSLYGTSSWALTSSVALSSSYALSGSYTLYSVFSNSSSYASTSTSASYALTSSYATYASDALYTISSSYALTSSYASFSSVSQNAQDVLLYVKNDSGQVLPKGTVVRIVGVDNSSNVTIIQLADYSNESNSANTLGFTNESFNVNAFGYVITEGTLLGVNTDGFTSGDLLYLSSSGTYTTTEPIAPKHGVRLGQVIRVQLNNGSIYVRIDNGAELGELHDVVDNTSNGSYGDLLIKSGSVWTNSKNLTGSYTVTGSFSGQTGSFINFYINNTGSAPSNSTDFGNKGEIRLSNNFIYIYANQNWMRVPIAKWN